MSAEDFRFRPMTPEEAPLALDLIRQRIAWMDERGLEEWNVQGYLNFFPLSYFQGHAEAGRLYGLWRGAEIAAAAVLLEQDRNWRDSAETSAFYIHNLAADVRCPGAGEAMIRRLLELARSRKKTYLRLDCHRDSPELNRYYERLGFRMVCPIEDHAYRGYCRQYPL